MFFFPSFQALLQNKHDQKKVPRYNNYVDNRFVSYPQRLPLCCMAIGNSYIHTVMFMAA